jgi:hypothetical protein
MDVVILKGKDTPANGWELLMTLRSLSRYSSLGQVYIIGYCPDWVNKDHVIHLDFPDPYSDKDASLLNKLIRVAWEDSLSDDFLLFSDDQPLLSLVHDDDFQPYVVEDLAKRKSFETGWQKRLKTSRDVLAKAGLTTFNFEGHIPYPINKQKARELMNYPVLSGKLTIFTAYYNYSKVEPVWGINDVRANLWKTTEIHKVGQAVDKKFASLRTDSMTNWAVVRLLEKMYPKPCAYELPDREWSIWTPEKQDVLVSTFKGISQLVI